MQDTSFKVRNETGATVEGVIEWGETVDVVRFTHPMTGELTENPVQGWADPPGETAHAEVAEMVAAVKGAEEFCADCAGYTHTEWGLIDGRLVFIGGEEVRGS
jgi:hypothetical protein